VFERERAPDRLAWSIDSLRIRYPHMSASRVLSSAQARLFAGAAAAILVGLVAAPVPTLIALNGLVALAYALVLIHNLVLWPRIVGDPTLVRIDDREAKALSWAELPMYTVLVAAYHEHEVIGEALQALARIDYPTSLLDVKLILEADDQATRVAAMAARSSLDFEIVLVPPSSPRTKPKALNYGLATARGDLITIYDAEDRPDPLQLRKAALAFKRADPQVACLQARLEYHNPHQNRLTRWFAVEYLAWFSRWLPAIAERGTPVPLGGTSMHIRRDALQFVGGWDPHNVTEDCDLGIRLYRMGYRTRILDSITYEEANSDFVNWVKQRSRWYKGFAQTWLVHMRRPLRLRRELGTSAFLGFNIVVGATTLVALLNPVFWVSTILWFLIRPDLIQTLYPGWIYFPGLICIVFGNFFAYYAGLITVRASNRPDLLGAVLLYPIYWAMMSVGAVRAFLQLIIAPFFWEKTAHGLDRPIAPEVI
jgi:glycosyltransferase XagB